MKKQIELNIDIYPIDISMKAAYNYIENTYIFFKKLSEKIYIIEFEKKNEKINLDDIIGNFKNDLLHESLRKNIAIETKNLRELIIARALYGFALENIEEDTALESFEIEDKNESLSYKDDKKNIGKSWF